MAEKFEIISTIISFSTDLHIEDDENFLFVFLWVAQPFLFWHDTKDMDNSKEKDEDVVGGSQLVGDTAVPADRRQIS